MDGLYSIKAVDKTVRNVYLGMEKLVMTPGLLRRYASPHNGAQVASSLCFLAMTSGLLRRYAPRNDAWGGCFLTMAPRLLRRYASWQ
jgi:hypothetical protein